MSSKLRESEIVMEVRRIVAGILQLPSEDLVREDTVPMGGEAEMDSIALADLIDALETRIGFRFRETDLRPRSFGSVRSLAEVIALRLREGP